MAMGYHPIIWAEAVDSYGNSLANSSLEVTELPSGFHSADNPMRPAATQHSEGNYVVRTAVAFIAGIVVAIVWERRQFGKNSSAWRLRYPRRISKQK